MRAFLAIAFSSCALLLAGCSSMPAVTTSSTGSGSGTVLRGMVHGGQNPIVGAHVYLLAVNNTGYGGPGIPASSSNASVSLLTSASGTAQDGSGNYYVTTDTNGDFTITGDYTCPSAYAHTYFYAAGGNPGSGANSAAVLVAPAQACATSNFTVVNEVSTVVSAYAFAGFSSDPTHTSSPNTTLAATGTQNAADTINNLEDPNTSVARATTPAGNGTVPQSEINTLANILAACVNSTGPGSTQCTTLFSNAMNGSTAPADTATAALNIAHNPGANISNLISLQTATSPFQPMLSATPTPNDFTIAVSYTGAGLNSPVPVAIDASGNVWIGNTATGANSVSKLSPLGAPISGASGYTGGGIVDPYSIAIDSSGNLWTGNVTPNSLSELSSTGTPISTSSGYTGGGLLTPYAIAFDSLGHAWVVNNVGGSLSEFSSTGSPISTSSGYTGGGLTNPVSLAIDVSGDAWVSDSITVGAVSEFNSSGSPISTSTGFTGGGLADPWGLAIDTSGNVWVADSSTGANRISLLGSSGSAISSSAGYTGGGLNIPEGIAIDGAGNVWVANRGSTNVIAPFPPSSISEFNSSGTAISPSTGYQAGLNLSLRLAIDGSGNVWVSNASLNTVTEFVGLASPVVTPIVGNLTGSSGSPVITNILPNPAAVGTSVTITGTNFGATQGGSTVTFNGTTASPTSWSATSITAPVPVGATTGNVVVTVGGHASTGYSFTVSAGTLPGDSVTWRYDNSRDGLNSNETTLTTANVNSTTFGKVGEFTVDGRIDGEVLYLGQISISGQMKNVIYFATENGTVYAVDADSISGTTATVLWSKSLVPSGEAPALNEETPSPCGNITTTGVLGTPVIDRGRNAIYAVAKTMNSTTNTSQFFRIHALDLTNGNELFAGPTTVSATYPGTAGNVSGGVVTFSARDQQNRPGLLETGGNIYVAFGGQYGDCGAYSGWVISYNADTLAQSGVIDLNPNSTQGGMWDGQAGPSADTAGSVYVVTANTGDTTTIGANDYPDSVVRLTNSGTLTVADYWTPFNAVTLDQQDLDLGSAGLLLLPDLVDSSSVVHHNAVAAGKDGNMYVVNRDNLGQFNSSTNNIVQTIKINGSGAVNENFSTPAYFNNNVYVCPSNETLKAFAISNALLATSATMSTTPTIGTAGFTISSNGTSNGIVWAIQPTNGNGVLYAFNASNLSSMLYASNQAAGNRDQTAQILGNFHTPTVANGRVYFGTGSTVAVFGVLP